MRIAHLGLLIVAAATPAAAQVVLSNQVFVESPAGVRKPSSQAFKGDWVIYVISYRNTSQQRIANYTINHQVASNAAFHDSETLGTLMSVDGGRTFAPLAQLRKRNADGSERAAVPADVTHMRWRIPIILEPGMGGDVGYRARLR